ncbi:MAG: hypothetical protein ABR588_09000 [Sphingomicrobium sp.]|nr:hypothetical protein [Sphingomonadales bacterium]
MAEWLGALALAIGAGVSALLLSPKVGWNSGLAAIGGGVAGLIAGWGMMRLVPGQDMSLALSSFEPVAIEPAAGEEPLVLDDVLDRVQPDSRVVRLFAAEGAPTAGQLKARIDCHLGQETNQRTGQAMPADATDALHAALEEIRRSLRPR